jgi:hypothetical protein
MDVSSRLLTEYVLYRTLIINKLKQIDPTCSEAEIHNIIVPRYTTLEKEDFQKDLYGNNVWLLDDKYMSYRTILSEGKMQNVIKAIALDGEKVPNDDNRPDITIVFSGDPEQSEHVDVIIVELKKKGLPLAKNEEVISQLRQRARKLLRVFPNKIQRIWFYGITDIDKDFRMSLKEDEYKELFSHGSMFYKPQKIMITEEEYVPAEIYVMTYETLIHDAEARNKSFLEVLKKGLKPPRKN